MLTERLQQFAETGLDLLFPPTCAGCSKLGTRWCENCQAKVPKIGLPHCELCGLPRRDPGVCQKCVAQPPPYLKMRSWAVFDFPIQNALHSLKYRRNFTLGTAIADQITEFVMDLQLPVDLIIPVPLGRQRLKQRGYNQVALVAQPLARRLNLPYTDQAITKRLENRSQVGLSIAERQENVKDAYLARQDIVCEKNILLLDDVATTGATIGSCSQAIMAAGAKGVYAITIARAISQRDLTRA